MEGGGCFKNGPWTSAEDAILVEHVKNYGEGKWYTIHSYSGLCRSGKSCRGRWFGNLRPNLRKGVFTPEEEQLVIKLHSKLGNKWVKIAQHLPSRCDNDIKNYWNTRIKKCQRLGLPIYPPDISSSTSSENQEGHNVGDFGSIYKIQNEILGRNDYDSPDIIFDDIMKPADALPFPEISFSNIVCQGFGSENYGFISQPTDCKSSQENEIILPAFPGSNELPSLQYSARDLSCFAYASSSQSETVDTYLQSPPTLSVKSGCSSPRNSGLLEVILHESQAMHGGKKQSSDRSLNSSVMTPSDFVADDLCYGAAWEDRGPISTSSYLAASVFNECAPPISGSPMDGLQPWSGPSGNHVNCRGTDNLLPNVVDVSTSNLIDSSTKLKPEFLRPDALLGSAWLLESNAIAALPDDDYCCERMSVPAETANFCGTLGDGLLPVE